MVKNFDVEEDEGLYFFRSEDFCETKESSVKRLLNQEDFCKHKGEYHLFYILYSILFVGHLLYAKQNNANSYQ